MQPLDYLFEIMITVFLMYCMFAFWSKYIRVNVKTQDDLLERYVMYERRR